MKQHITPVIIGIIKQSGKYLLTKRCEKDTSSEFHDLWHLPGGGLKFGEKPDETIVREMKEELGLSVKVKRMLSHVFSRVRDDKWQGLLMCYVLTLVDPDEVIHLNREASEFGWFTQDEILQLNTFDLTREILEYEMGNIR
ncbi:hypothetical protein COY90_03690 [Candidatus Roizmanbacteria bacterium CG_4_10_14_0_8_um_filter_39_9]|uniref:Nudix hydrolase domain-containing protein n=1 Tax=Candidatus Roizmanbacteria bacterium CG_4_10_14_0_8_um_filter_39_9 TaxID=1974829 RepID=A0A2M7QCB2_9BACT|nr:MAG: hypothetical protein COY90_03690 [Candidatus Roizmanbacteria bacterium CG_4_10_14_0_8_um_filter_39_9]